LKSNIIFKKREEKEMPLKEMMEKRNAIIEEMKAITAKATTENRSVNEDEAKVFEQKDAELRSLEAAIKIEERSRELSLKEVPAEKTEESKKEDLEIRSFANFVRKSAGQPIETRAGEQNLTMGNNGAVIPVTIAQMVITAVKELCPIFEKSTMFNVPGTFKVPVWGLANTTHDITVAFQAEFTDITADSGKFTSVDLTGYLVGALTLIGKSVINSSDIDVVNLIVKEMAKKIAIFLEGKFLNGQSSYNTGALSTTNTMNAGSTTAITADNLIDLQAKVPSVYQANCGWTMATATFSAIRKLKDGQGQYLLQQSLAEGTPFLLLGKPVYISDNMPAIGSANKAILYGDYSGLAVNMRETLSIELLMEKYATMHAIGVVAWMEFDSNVIDHQKLATLVMSA